MLHKTCQRRRESASPPDRGDASRLRCGSLWLCLIAATTAAPWRAEAQGGSPFQLTAKTIASGDLPPMTMGGYCPVALRLRGTWEPGDPRLAAEFDGRQYLLSGPRELTIFAASPQRFVPTLGGDCIVTFAESGRRVPGRLDEGIVFRDRIFLFSTADAHARFEAEPGAFADADLFAGGVCPVTLTTSGAAMPGDPKTGITFANGLRFRFVDAAARRAFLQQPAAYVPAELQAAARGKHAASPADAQRSGRRVAGAADHADLPREPAGAANPGAEGQAAGADRRVGGTLSAAEPLLNGYCPVTIWTRPDNMWIRGQYAQRCEIDGMVFLPAGLGERQQFEADPALFIPALGGDCVVTYVDTGRRVKGSVYHTVVDKGAHRLYLCADAAAKQKLSEDPTRYADADVAAGGMCVVTRRDAGVSQPGSPLTSVWFEGERYYFVGKEQRAKFLAAPETYSAPIADE